MTTTRFTVVRGEGAGNPERGQTFERGGVTHIASKDDIKAGEVELYGNWMGEPVEGPSTHSRRPAHPDAVRMQNAVARAQGAANGNPLKLQKLLLAALRPFKELPESCRQEIKQAGSAHDLGIAANKAQRVYRELLSGQAKGSEPVR